MDTKRDFGTLRARWAVLVGVCIGMMTGIAAGGFDWPREKPGGGAIVSDAQLTYDGESLGEPGDAISATLRMKIIDEFDLMDDPDVGTDPDAMTKEQKADAKVEVLRQNIGSAIDLIAKEDEAMAACLGAMVEDGRLCLDFRSARANGACLPDRLATGEGDRINIRANFIPCELADACNAQQFIMLTTLYHEGLHAKQEWLRAADPSNPTDMELACIRERRECNEVDAEDLEIRLQCELLALLDVIIFEGVVPVPPDDPGLADCIVMELASKFDTIEELQSEALLLAIAISNAKQDDQDTREWRDGRKAAATLWKSGDITRMEFWDIWKNGRWAEARLRRAIAELIRHISLVSGPTSNGLISQWSLDEASNNVVRQDLATPFDRVLDFAFAEIEVSPGEFTQQVFVAGVVDSSFGPEYGVYAFFDFDVDGLFEQGTGDWVLLPTAFFQSPISITYDDGFQGRVLILDPAQKMVFSQFDVNGDTFPDPVLPPLSLPQSFSPVEVEVTRSGTGLYLFDDLISDAPALGIDVQTFGAVADGVGVFEPAPLSNALAEACFPPVFTMMPSDGDTSVAAHAMPGTVVEVFLDPMGFGDFDAFLGAGPTGDEGFTGPIPVAPALLAGDALLLLDPENNKQSKPVIVEGVGCPADFNDDGQVDGADFGFFGAAFGSDAGEQSYDPRADFNNDGTIDGADFGAFGAQFGRTDCVD